MAYLQRRPPTFVQINDIDQNLSSYLVKVRVVKLWTTFKDGKENTMEMVLADSMGTRIHCIIDEDMLKKFGDKFMEGGSYSISNFPCVPYINEYRTNPLPYRMGFYRTTSVDRCMELPQHVPGLYYAKFQDIIEDKLDRSIMIDVIGQMVDSGEIFEGTSKLKNTTFTKLTISLRDLDGKRLTCTLWGEHAKQVTAYVQKFPDKPVVCVIRFCSIKDWQDEVIVSNSFGATEVFLNPTFPEVKAFRAKLPKDGMVMAHGENSKSEYQINYHDEFFVKNPKLDLASFKTIEEPMKFVTSAVVGSIDTYPRWYYISCNVCKKKVQPCEDVPETGSPPLFDCLTCDKNVTDVVARFRLVMNVYDSDGVLMTFVAFDRVMERFLGHSAHELAEEVAHEPSTVLPSALLKLIDQKLLFKVAVTSENLRFRKSALRLELICGDDVLVRRFGDQEEVEGSPLMESAVPSNLKRVYERQVSASDDGQVRPMKNSRRSIAGKK